jgi:hypothetical protein
MERQTIDLKGNDVHCKYRQRISGPRQSQTDSASVRGKPVSYDSTYSLKKLDEAVKDYQMSLSTFTYLIADESRMVA